MDARARASGRDTRRSDACGRDSRVQLWLASSVAAVQCKPMQADNLVSTCTAKLTPVKLASSPVHGPFSQPMKTIRFVNFSR